jgi:hypothetical protein
MQKILVVAMCLYTNFSDFQAKHGISALDISNILLLLWMQVMVGDTGKQVQALASVRSKPPPGQGGAKKGAKAEDPAHELDLDARLGKKRGRMSAEEQEESGSDGEEGGKGRMQGTNSEKSHL